MLKYRYTSNELIDSSIESILSVFEQTKSVVKKLVESIEEDFKKIEKIKEFVSTLERDNKEYINNLNSLLKETNEIEGGIESLKKIIEICISSLTKIFEDNIVSIKDVPIFINMIMDIFSKLKEQTKEDVKKNIDINKMIGLCDFVCKVLIIFMNKDGDTQIFIQILETSIKLVKFDLNSKEKYSNYLCFLCC